MPLGKFEITVEFGEYQHVWNTGCHLTGRLRDLENRNGALITLHMEMVAMNLDEVCDNILAVDGSIRVAGIADKMGRVISYRVRKDVTQLLTLEEVKGSVIKSVLRMKTREDYESKLGRVIYTFTLYEKVKRASIPIQNDEYVLLIVSFERNADHERIILSGILPLIKRHGLIR